jgi:cob(I)alamin adenosyltransferase
VAHDVDRFQDPTIGIHKVYTRTGDDGTTGLVGGQRVPKGDPRIDAYGTVDELMAVVGLCRAATPDLDDALARVQHQLFNVGSILATLPEDVGAKQPRVTANDIEWLESVMDEANEFLPALTSFVLPGPGESNARLHLARTVCRRAERLVVGMEGCVTEAQYLNRLSDALFVWARQAAGGDETLWDPNL